VSCEKGVVNRGVLESVVKSKAYVLSYRNMLATYSLTVVKNPVSGFFEKGTT
jgi:hypothetical protein